MNWFKFYGQDFLTDPKIKQFTIGQQLAWVYLLSLASQNDGTIEFLTEHTLAGMMGLLPTDDDWNCVEGVFELFEKYGMITIDNNDNKMITIVRYHERQNSNLSSYERVKRYREKHKIESKNDNAVKRYHDNARIDKIRIDNKEINKEKKFSSIKDITPEVIKEIADYYHTSVQFVNVQFEKMKNWLESSGKVKKNYKATLRNFVISEVEKNSKGGKIEIGNKPDLKTPVSIEQTPEERKRAMIRAEQIREDLKTKGILRTMKSF